MPAFTIDDLRSTLDSRGRESELPVDLVFRATERGEQLRHRRAVRRNSTVALIITGLVVTAGLALTDANGEALPPPAVPRTTSPVEEPDLQKGDVVLVIAGPQERADRTELVSELQQGGFTALVADGGRFPRVPPEQQRVVVVLLTAATVEEGIAMCESVRTEVGLSACDSSTVQQVIGGPSPLCEEQTPQWPHFGWRRCD